jgi:hypothetical protein
MMTARIYIAFRLDGAGNWPLQTPVTHLASVSNIIIPSRPNAVASIRSSTLEFMPLAIIRFRKNNGGIGVVAKKRSATGKD